MYAIKTVHYITFSSFRWHNFQNTICRQIFLWKLREDTTKRDIHKTVHVIIYLIYFSRCILGILLLLFAHDSRLATALW